MNSPSILICDKEQAVWESLQYVLSEEGFCCHIARNDLELWETLSSFHVDVVIIDGRCLANGVIKQIKEPFRNTRIIVLTTYFDIGIAFRALRERADRFLLRPVDFDELIHTIRDLMPTSPAS